MSDTKKRGRPRAFCEAAALDAAGELFAARGFDAVTIAELTRVMGIAPPSFYAAFASKAALYERVLDRRIAADPFVDEVLSGADTLRGGIAALLRAAASRYANGTGCLVAEGARACSDETASSAARARLAATRGRIEAFVAERDGDPAIPGAVVTALFGLSAAARAGAATEELDAFADTVARGLFPER